MSRPERGNSRDEETDENGDFHETRISLALSKGNDGDTEFKVDNASTSIVSSDDESDEENVRKGYSEPSKMNTRRNGGADGNQSSKTGYPDSDMGYKTASGASDGGAFTQKQSSLFGLTRDAISRFDADAYDRIASGDTYVFGLSRNAFFLLVILGAFILFSVTVGTFYGYKGEPASPVPALEGIARQPRQLLEGSSSTTTDRDSSSRARLQTIMSSASSSGSEVPAMPPTVALPTIASTNPITADQAASAMVATSATTIEHNKIYPDSLPHTEIQRREATRKAAEKERRNEIEQLVKMRDALRRENADIRSSITGLHQAIKLNNPRPALVLKAPIPDGVLKANQEKSEGGSSKPETAETEVILQQLSDPNRRPEGAVIVSDKKTSGSSSNDKMVGRFGKPDGNADLKRAILMKNIPQDERKD